MIHKLKLCCMSYCFKMASLREEISDLTVTLDQLAKERENLLQALQIQEDNFYLTYKEYQEKVEELFKQKDEKIEELKKQQN